MQGVKGKEVIDEEVHTETVPQSHILIDKDDPAVDLAHDFTTDANAVNRDESQDNSNMDPSVQPNEGEGEVVQAEDLDKK